MATTGCCHLPPVEAQYTPKGTYTQLKFDGQEIKTYVNGPEDAKAAVFYIYDIFGLAPQTLQGADLLASQGFRVYLPDILHGDYAQPAWYSGADLDGEKKRTAWFSKFPGETSSQNKQIGGILKAIKSSTGAKVGLLGACWGYKAIVLCDDLNEASAMVGTHPSFGDPSDADRINIPCALLPTKFENMTLINAIYKGLEEKNPGKNLLKHYDTMDHGFSAARGDLSNPDVREKFADAYTTISEFFKKYLV